MKTLKQWAFLAALLLFAAFISCRPGHSGAAQPENSAGQAGDSQKGQPAAALSASGGDSGESETPAEAILEKGNIWSAGVPGFDENALSALSGNYRFRGTSYSGGFSIWLTREFLYYDKLWQERATVDKYRTRQKQTGDMLLVSLEINSVWTGIFRFSGDIPQNDIDLIVVRFASRFLYFSAQSSLASDISLPAVLNLGLANSARTDVYLK